MHKVDSFVDPYETTLLIDKCVNKINLLLKHSFDIT